MKIKNIEETVSKIQQGNENLKIQLSKYMEEFKLIAYKSYTIIKKEDIDNTFSKVYEKAISTYDKETDYDFEKYFKIMFNKSLVLKGKKLLQNDNNLLKDTVDKKIKGKVISYSTIERIDFLLKKYDLGKDLDIYINILKEYPKILAFLEEKLGKKEVNVALIEEFKAFGLFIDSYLVYKNIDINEDIDFTTIKKESNMNAFDLYMNDITRYPLLSWEEEKELALNMKTDEKAKEKFINSNLRLVVSVAKRYLNKNRDFMDLISAGNIGLLTAVDKFDIEKGFRFSTYATWWISQSITRSLYNTERAIRLPAHVHGSLSRFLAVKNKLTSTLGREPTVDELMEQLNFKREKIEILAGINDTSSLNVSIKKEDADANLEFIDALIDKDVNVEEEVTGNITTSLFEKFIDNSHLNEREKIVIKERFGFNSEKQAYSLAEVGKKMGRTRERVRQIEASALYKLRTNNEVRNYTNYLDNPEKAISALEDLILYQEHTKNKAYATPEEIEKVKKAISVESSNDIEKIYVKTKNK